MQLLDYAAVPGVAECRLDDKTLASLPANEAPAPWDCDLSAVLWWARAGAAARAAAADVLAGGRAPLAVIGGLVSYANTPVGAYHEVLGAIALRRGKDVVATVPFMAVDSTRSLVGGRGNWSLPKSLARFRGEPGAGTASAAGAGWSVSVSARPFGPRFPVAAKGTLVQPWPDGAHRAARLAGRSRARLAVVTVAVESDADLPNWLRPGRHLGAVLSQTRFTLSESQ